jgi:hypothetical protein
MQNAGRGVKIKERKVEEEKRACTCKCRLCAIYTKSMDAGTGSGGSRLETQGGPMGKKICDTTYKLSTYNRNSRY